MDVLKWLRRKPAFPAGEPVSSLIAVKLCKDCKHHKASYDNDPSLATCGMVKEPVNGFNRYFCERLRSLNYSDTCGPSAKWFEPKPVTLFGRIKEMLCK